MSGDRLREAAKVLRERAEAATAGPWEAALNRDAEPYVTEQGRAHFGMTAIPNYGNKDYGKADAAYIATMHPGVGLALADWLDKDATRAEVLGTRNYAEALTLADHILGAQS